jgi:cytochrome P450
LSVSHLMQDPYPYYEARRQFGSVQFLEQQGYWLVIDHRDVSSALNMPEVFCSDTSHQGATDLKAGSHSARTSLRQALIPHFSARGLSEMNSYIVDCARALLRKTASKSEFDIVGEFAAPLPQHIMGHLLGFVEDEIKHLENICDRTMPEPYADLDEFFGRYIRASQSVPDKSGIRNLIGGATAKELSEMELVNFLKLLWFSGTRTVSMLLSTSIYLLLHHHAVRYELRSNLSLIPQFIDEVLRFDSPEQMLPRVTSRETELAGITIPANAQVRLCIGAANRDPKQYASPDLFLFGRNPKDHLAFGAGSHYCLGALLTRLEARIALETLLQVCPDTSAVHPAQCARYLQSDRFRELEELLVRV